MSMAAAEVTTADERAPLLVVPESPPAPAVSEDPTCASDDEVSEEEKWAPYYEDYGYATDIILSTNIEQGLTAEQAEERLEIFGRNEYERERPNQLLALLDTFREPMANVIWVAILIEVIQTCDKWPGSDARTSLVDVFVLLLLQFLNGFVGWYENMRAEEKMHELLSSIQNPATVTRDSKTFVVSEKDLVPGDIITLPLGACIPADCKLIDDHDVGIRVDESVLTGETKPVKKFVDESSPPLGCANDRCIGQTKMSSGRGKALVLRTGRKVI